MDGNDFLVLAIRLSSSSGEAELRTAVSRAYYGVFHAAREFVVDECSIQVSEGPEAHGQIVGLLNHLGTRAGAIASSKFGSLKGLRNKADYKLTAPIQPQWVRLQIREATEILSLIGGHRGNESAIESVRAYASRFSSFRLADRKAPPDA